MLEPQATEGSSGFRLVSQRLGRLEGRVMTGIALATPDMPITDAHLHDMHLDHLPPQSIPAPSSASLSLSLEDLKHHFMIADFLLKLSGKTLLKGTPEFGASTRLP